MESDGNNGTFDQIVLVAGRLFSERGYEGTSVNAIAEGAGVKGAALYWHFESKEDICLEFLKRTASSYLAAIEEEVVAEDPITRLRQFVRTHVKHPFGNWRPTSRRQMVFNYGQLRSKLSADKRAGLDEVQDRFVGVLREIIEDGVAEGDFVVDDTDMATYAVFGLSEFVSLWFDPEGRVSLSEVAEIYERLALRMVQAPELPGR